MNKRFIVRLSTEELGEQLEALVAKGKVRRCAS